MIVLLQKFPAFESIWLFLFPFLVALPPAALTAGEPAGPRVAVYFPDYRYKAGHLGPFYGTTNLILFSAKPNQDGSVDFSRVTPEMIAMGKDARKKSGLKVTFCVGGWGRGKLFATAVSNAPNRERFANELVAFCTKHHLDGVDIDWEFPRGEKEHADFTLFLKDLSKKLHRGKRILSVALGSTRPLSRDAYDVIDEVNLMSYQPWNPEPYEAWLEKAVQRILDSGLDPAKLNIGLGFFAKELGGERRAISWSKLASRGDRSLPESEFGFSPVGQDASGLRLKLIKKYHLGGIMIWDYGHDSGDPETSLLKYISDGTTR